MKTLGIAYVISLIFALVLTPVMARLGRLLGLVDRPHARKVHATAIPRCGGVAILLALLVGALPILWWNHRSGELLHGPAVRVFALVLGAAAVFLLGLLDDMKALHGRWKLLALFVASAGLCAAGIRVEELSVGGWFSVKLGWVAWPVTMLWIVSVTVGINFIDGLDGLAAGVGAIASAVIAVVALHSGQANAALLSLALLGSLCGFLVYNFHPATIFMGDSGSMLLGFVLAATSVMCCNTAPTSFALGLPALALGVPVFDTLFTLIRRGVLQRRSLFAAERGHIHHRMLDAGFRHKHVVLVLYGVTLACSGLGLLMLCTRSSGTLLLFFAVMAVLAVLFRTAGSVRVRETLQAVRRNREIAREIRACRDTFEESQLRLRTAVSVEDWWREVCWAAGLLGFVRLSLPLVRREGTAYTLSFARPVEDPSVKQELVSATVPIRHRRTGAPLALTIEIDATRSLESAGRRVMAFARLVGEMSLAELPPGPPRVRPAVDVAGHVALVKGIEATSEPSGLASTEEAAQMARWARLFDEEAQAAPAAEIGGGDQAVATAGSVLGAEPVAAKPPRRVAIVHDFLYTYAGAERVLEQLLHVYPDADVFSLFDFMPESQRGFLRGKKPTSSFIQRMPLARKKHRAYLPLMPLAIEQMDVSAYDLVLSSSYMVAKGVLTRPDQLHVCYCHTPVRFAWDLQNQYLPGGRGFVRRAKSMLARMILHYIRSWDTRSATGVDVFIANSKFISRRIAKAYRRDSVAIYPPVDVERFTPRADKEEFYLTASRLVPYKRIDLIVEAFNQMPSRRLVVIGEGPDLEKLRAMAGPNVTVLGHQPFGVLKDYLQRARAFVFAAEEDFGIAPVEAQACGTPVIAYGRGGVTESVIDGRTGLFFEEQSARAIIDAVSRFEAVSVWDPREIRVNAERFSAERFRGEIRALVSREWTSFRRRCVIGEAADVRVTDAEAGATPLTPGAAALHDLASGVDQTLLGANAT